MSENTNEHSRWNCAPIVRNDFHLVLKHLVENLAVYEKRSEARTPRSLSLMIQPLDLDFQPDGDSFYAIMRDISSSGMGFINSEPLRHEFVRITMPEQTRSRVIARVCYNLSIGTDYPLYLVGVKFVS